MPVEKTCESCGKSFVVPPCRKDSARFCSNECKNQKGNWGNKRVECVCQHCGTLFLVWEAWIRKGAGKYCSRKCGNKKPLDVQQIASLYEGGLSSRQIGEKLDVSDVTIRRRLYEVGVSLRSAEDGIKLAYKEKVGPKHPLHLGRRKDSKGYWLVWIGKQHPRTDRKGYIRENILVWQQANNAILPRGWVVHHKNEIKTDNRPENLEAMPWGKHTNLHNDLRKGELEIATQRIRDLEAEVESLKAQLTTKGD